MLFAVLIGIALLLTELTLRWWSLGGSDESRDHVVETWYLPATLRPNHRGRFWGIEFKTNEYGFRDEPDFPEMPSHGEYRVLSMGDSIGFGLGVEANEHYSKVAQRILQLDSEEATSTPVLL